MVDAIDLTLEENPFKSMQVLAFKKGPLRYESCDDSYPNKAFFLIRHANGVDYNKRLADPFYSRAAAQEVLDAAIARWDECRAA